jgi:tetratricopeptide (TPR) repeat protein
MYSCCSACFQSGRRCRQKFWTGPQGSLPALIIILVLLLTQLPLAAIGQEKGLSREQPALSLPEPVLQLSRTETAQQLQKGTADLTQLSKEFQQRVEKHLQYAGSYDLESFAKNDDEINVLLEQMDASFLDLQKLTEQSKTSSAQLDKSREEIQRTKLLMYKSSAIFYLCFGRPLQAMHLARLGLGIAEPHGNLKDYSTDMLFYLGSALCWAGEYKSAEADLKRALRSDADTPYTQLKPGETVNVAGKNPFTPCVLASVYLAESQTGRAIDLLKSSRRGAPGDEVRGNVDALLALAYTLDKKPALAGQHAQLAAQELNEKTALVFPALAKESLGIAAALSGNYELAESRLSEALPALQASPIKLGNRLEAAQTALWRSYCREKLGKKDGSAEDRSYAMNLAGEAPHLNNVSTMLDALFGKNLSGQRVEPARDKWALVVGISNFADPAVPRLRYSRKDADDVSDFLIHKAGFSASHVKTLVDSEATRANLLDCLTGSWLPRVSHAEDLVFLFISSHGTPAYLDMGVLNSVVTYDTSLNHLFTTSLPMQSIVRMLGTKLPQRHALVVLDTCYAGGLGAPGSSARSIANVDPDMLLNSSRQLLVSSSGPHERSWESKRYQNSIFTRQLIDSLVRERQRNELRSVFPTIRDRVSSEVSSDYLGNTQTPGLSGLWSGRGTF